MDDVGVLGGLIGSIEKIVINYRKYFLMIGKWKVGLL